MNRFLLSKLKSSFRKLLDNFNYTALCALLDVVFFLVYGVLSYFAMNVVLYQLSELSDYLSANPELVVGLASNPVYRQLFNKIIIALLLMFAFLYIFYAVLHGTNWFIVNRKFLGFKAKFWSFVGKFSLVNLIYLVVIAVVVFFTLRTSFSTLFQTEKIIWIVFTIVIVVILYFMFISNALIFRNNLKQIFAKTFRIGIRRIFSVISMYIILAVIGFVINLILNLLSKLSYAAMLVAGIVLFLPYITLFRTYVTDVINKLDEKKKIKTENKVKKK